MTQNPRVYCSMCRDRGEMIFCKNCDRPVCTYQGAAGCIQLTAESGTDDFQCPSCYRKAEVAVPVSAKSYICRSFFLKQLNNIVSRLQLQLTDIYEKITSTGRYFSYLRADRKSSRASCYEDTALG
jgi:hypothetical protein